MDRQDIFNIVAKHLLTQNAKSDNEKGHCLYRGPSGLKCAIGALIKDEFYDPMLEGHGTDHIDVQNALAKSGIDCNGSSDEAFFNSLQAIHDHYDVDEWHWKLVDFALKHGLVFRGVDSPEAV